jgi:IS605 OrfB family transposase
VVKVHRIESIYIEDSSLSYWCHLSKNLWNESNYIIRQKFINEKVYLNYYDVWDIVKKESENYRLLPIHSSQQILRLLDKAWKGFFRCIKDWKKNPDKYLGIPKIPGYKKKDGEFVLPFDSSQVRLKNGIFKLPKKIGLEVKTRLGDVKLCGARIVPQGIGYQLEIIYEKKVPDVPISSERIAGIDLGVNNLATVVNNIGEQSIIINGKVVKSWNQYFNKEKARLIGIYDKQNPNLKKRDGFKLRKLSLKRKFKIRDYFHKASRKVIEWCVKHRIDTLVVGRNDGWKQNINIGKRNNQNFVNIPFDILRNQLSYKGEDVGILVIDHEEAHTSKCSFLDMEPIEHRERYLGRRVKRGLFKSSDGTKINADVNGGANIIRKAFPNAFAKGIEGIGVYPRRLNLNHSSLLNGE